jgi:hypothetical protein
MAQSKTNQFWFITFLSGYFLTNCFTYIFPLMILLLTDRGLSGTHAAAVQSLSLLLAAFIVPRLGIRLDQGKHKSVILGVGVCVFLGILPFAFQNLPLIITVLSSLFFVVGAAAINICVTRFTEGLAESGELKKRASLTYLSSNCALGISSCLAYLFIANHQKTLISLDVISSLFFVTILYVGYQTVGAKKSSATSVKQEYHLISFFKKFPLSSIAVAALFTTLYCHISAIPLLYLTRIGSESKSYQALMMLTNTIVVVFVSFIYSKALLKIKESTLFFITCLLAALPHFIVPYWISPLAAIVLSGVSAIGEALAYPLVTNWILGYFAKEQAGQAVGIRDALIKLSLISAPLLGALCYQGEGILFSAIFGGLPLISAAFYFRLNRQPLKSGSIN